MKIKALLASIALVLSGTSAMAAVTCDKGSVTSWDSLGPPDIEVFGNSFSAPVSSFSDCYTFSLDSAANAFGGVIEIDLLSKLNINVSSVSLFLGDLLIGTQTASPDAYGLTFSFGNLAGGDGYTLQVAGGVTGRPFGFDVGYAGLISTVAAPVPEPGVVALMIAGLLGVGAVAWRRRDA